MLQLIGVEYYRIIIELYKISQHSNAKRLTTINV